MATEFEKMVAGELYDPADPLLMKMRERARELCRQLNAAAETEHELRTSLQRELFASGGDEASIQAPFFCDYGSNIHLGKRVYFNFNCVVLDVCPVHIGEHTLFGPAVQIYTATHPLDAEQRRTHEYAKPIRIGSDCWVGGGAIILPGVTIGDRTVVGAGSVVTKDLPSNVIAAGNPCRVIRPVEPR
ncbi:MAG TPA: sugar O-acetyltransferase [Polyangiaceae bacterium]|nr:sugar O-acetyltransferase [Polyangiaceae bacterium]